MKVADVPQDPGHLLAGHQKLNYAVGDDGKYTGVPTIGWEVEIAATNVSNEAAGARVRTAWDDARAGRTSPLAYHMTVAQMDVALLAMETGIWRWRVRRHLKADVFATLHDTLVARYAEAMGMTLSQVRALPDAPDVP